MNPVIYFEIPVQDVERATQFYEEVFGYKLARAINARTREPYASIFPRKKNQAGAFGILLKAKENKPSKAGVVVYFSSDNIENTLCKATKNGGVIVSPSENTGIGYTATIEDTEGNLIGILQECVDENK
ncbi:glyoxalase [Leminorella grimontii]|uniref:Glyoxalase n=1 Tax=Leminorella grimontii TaxID=82981 RepID=A0AAV5MYC5_9GAMM|nr:VOC family protein [Leminorella grimontii]KFC95974.1 glyoxalase family protein [Leminorella grimontii ATCC 33999 = DSM 5078]GKX54846.1 glyoxalase [Leminorella grimontii]VFS58332.1 Predicted enzyme related to lactoylglutathione lyase [Leminorella grimontii]